MFYSHNPFLNDATEEKGKLTFILILKVKKSSKSCSNGYLKFGLNF